MNNEDWKILKDSVKFKSDHLWSQIYPELLGLDQEDPTLIAAIREKVLIAPPPKKTQLNIEKKHLTWKELRGQFGQVEAIINDAKKFGIDLQKKTGMVYNFTFFK